MREADVRRSGSARPAAAESYLSIPALLEAADRTGAEPIHPGYGFLSERAAFARAVTDAGLVFIGPPADVMDAMGRKDRAREIAVAAGVPVVPAADVRRIADLDAVAAEVGFPLLVKAAAGGGGKGMRIVRAEAELADAVAAARREAASAFGDDTMLFERYVEHGRHIEVQILADEHGNVVHLFERDCSVQRRHQKVLEEAPATDDLRRGPRRWSPRRRSTLAREVGYVNAGTVEFLVAGRGRLLPRDEHPTPGRAPGHRARHRTRPGRRCSSRSRRASALPFDAGPSVDVTRPCDRGARLRRGPVRTGSCRRPASPSVVAWPTRARVDAALESGQRVGTHYDPMLGKVIVCGTTA